MSFSSQFYIDAEHEFKAKRAANDAKSERRHHEITEKIPVYKDLRAQLAKTGGKLSRLFFSDDQDIKSRLKALEEENLSIQEKINNLLQKNGYDKNYLDPIYSCSHCNDTGIYENRRCKCFMDAVKRRASAKINNGSPISLSSFDTFDLNLHADARDRKNMRFNLDRCKHFAENFHLPCAYEGILMIGKTGLGKTHLSLAIANDVLNKNYSVIYGSAPDLFRKIEDERFGRVSYDQGHGTADMLQRVDLLILDDLGSEIESKYYVADFYNLLNSRVNAGLPMIINTNLLQNDLNDRYGERITSRILTMDCLIFSGSDIRAVKKYGLKNIRKFQEQ